MKDVQVAATINSIEAKVDSFRQELESINHYINCFKTQIDELSKKPNVPEEFETFKSITQEFIKEINSKQKSTVSSIDVLRVSIDSIRSVLIGHELKLTETKATLPILENKISTVEQEISQKIVSISSVFSNRLADHVERQKKYAENFALQALSAPKSVVESNNALLDKIEVSRLDGANAILKTSNLELAIKLLERKLENLTLQVKKIELSQPIA